MLSMRSRFLMSVWMEAYSARFGVFDRKRSSNSPREEKIREEKRREEKRIIK